VSVVCCQVEGSATVRSLIQRRPTERGVSECDLETSTMRKTRPTRAVEPFIYIYIYIYNNLVQNGSTNE
jgi:hypothetical protein